MLEVYQRPKNAFFPLKGLLQGNKCCLCSFFNRKSDPTKIRETCSEIKISTFNAKKRLYHCNALIPAKKN